MVKLPPGQYMTYTAHLTNIPTRTPDLRYYIIRGVGTTDTMRNLCIKIKKTDCRNVVFYLPVSGRDHHGIELRAVPPTPKEEYCVRLPEKFENQLPDHVDVRFHERTFITFRNPIPSRVTVSVWPLEGGVNQLLSVLAPQPEAEDPQIKKGFLSIVFTTRDSNIQLLNDEDDLKPPYNKVSFTTYPENAFQIRQYLESRVEGFRVKDDMFKKQRLWIFFQPRKELEERAIEIVTRMSLEGVNESDIVASVQMPLRSYIIKRLCDLGSKKYDHRYMENNRTKLYDRGPNLSSEQTIQLLDAYYWTYLAPEKKDFQMIIDFYHGFGRTIRLKFPHEKDGESIGRTSASGNLRKFSSKRRQYPESFLRQHKHIVVSPEGKLEARTRAKPRIGPCASVPSTPQQVSPALRTSDPLSPLVFIKKEEPSDRVHCSTTVLQIDPFQPCPGSKKNDSIKPIIVIKRQPSDTPSCCTRTCSVVEDKQQASMDRHNIRSFIDLNKSFRKRSLDDLPTNYEPSGDGPKKSKIEGDVQYEVISNQEVREIVTLPSTLSVLSVLSRSKNDNIVRPIPTDITPFEEPVITTTTTSTSSTIVDESSNNSSNSSSGGVEGNGPDVAKTEQCASTQSFLKGIIGQSLMPSLMQEEGDSLSSEQGAKFESKEDFMKLIGALSLGESSNGDNIMDAEPFHPVARDGLNDSLSDIEISDDEFVSEETSKFRQVIYERYMSGEIGLEEKDSNWRHTIPDKTKKKRKRSSQPRQTTTGNSTTTSSTNSTSKNTTMILSCLYKH